MGIPTLPNQPPKPQIEGHEAEGEKKDNASSSRLVQQDVPDFYCEKHLFFFSGSESSTTRRLHACTNYKLKAPLVSAPRAKRSV